MPLVNLARDMIMDALMGGSSYTRFNNANAHIGVGDSTTAFDAAQTDLQAATNKLRKPMVAGYPTRTANAVSWRSLFGLSDANYTWEERGIFNALSSGQMLSRRVTTIFSGKTSSLSAQITCTDTHVLA